VSPAAAALAAPASAALAAAQFAALDAGTTSSCGSVPAPIGRVIGASAEHSPAHHLNGCCCGAGCAAPTGGGTPTGQASAAGSSVGCGADATGQWSLPYGREPRDSLAV
jgi:hypothetical protein